MKTVCGLMLLFCLLVAVLGSDVFAPLGGTVLLELDAEEGRGTIISTSGVGLVGDLVLADVSQCTAILLGNRQYCSLKGSDVFGKISRTTSSDIPYELSDFVEPQKQRMVKASGYVVDCSTSFVAGVLLAIGGSITTTNENGEFSFVMPAKGTLRILKDGYAPQEHNYEAPAGVTEVTVGFVVFERVLTGNQAAAAITWEQGSDTDTFIVTPQLKQVYYGNRDADGAHFFVDRGGLGPECVFIDDVSTGTWQLWAEMNGQMGMHAYFQVGTKVFAAHSTRISDEDWAAGKNNWHALDYNGGTATIVDIAADPIPGVTSGDAKHMKKN